MKYFLVFILCISTCLIHGQVLDKIDLRLTRKKQLPSQQIVVILNDQADISGVKMIKGKDAKASYVYQQLVKKSDETQGEIKEFLNNRKITFRSFYIVNMLSLSADWNTILELSKLPSVKEVIEDSPYKKLDLEEDRSTISTRAIEWGITKIGAPSVWTMGYTGQNVIIGGQDTGYEWDDPTLKTKYRGWNGVTANHNYHWHDAIHADNPMSSGTNSCGFNSAVPCDDDNHGTHTMGTMVGDDGLGNQIGVAPGAKWIGCRNMENGYGTLTTYTECFEWFLAPYPLAGGVGDPTKMPHVINNSWGCPTVEGCNISNWSTIEIALNNLRSAGCVVVVSAGNSGSNCSSVQDPAAIFEGSLSVGATNSTDGIASFSSRGPVLVDNSSRQKPNVSAPGVGVRSCIRGSNNFASYSGTSMAGPHVAGLVALIISANPNLAGEVEQIETIIEQTALNLSSTQNCTPLLGSTTPNNTFGFGRIDAVAAVNRALNPNFVPLIKTDQFGYRPSDEKIAILSDPQIGYNSTDSYTPSATMVVKNSTTFQVVFTGSPIAWNGGATHDQSGDKVWRFDFSALTTPGKYHVADGQFGDIRSEDFEIKETVYNDVLQAAFKTFYYQRSSFPKSTPYAAVGFTDGASHNQDMFCRFINDPTNTTLYKNMSGGWYDAGDYNKYVNFTAKTLNDLLLSFEINPQAWASDNMQIPESSNGIPDLLDEVKYELDWLLKMQDNDGGVHCVVGVQNNATASPPSADFATRYYGPKTTSASFTVAGAFAFAAKQFKKINHSNAQSYATALQSKAILAWNWAIANPNQTYYNSGIIAAGEQEVDAYGRSMLQLAAAVYLYDLTNQDTYKNYVEANYTSSHLIQWSFVYPFENYIQQSLLYYSHLPGVSSTVANNIKNAYRGSIDNYTHNYLAHVNDVDAYKAHLENNNIGWGSNQIKCNLANLFQTYHHFNLDLNKNNNIEKILSHYVHYIHGVNPNGLTYLTNMSSYGAEKSINTIYHSWFADGSVLWDDVRSSAYGPAPGFLSGGPNPGWSLDGCCPASCGSPANNAKCINQTPPNGQPRLKSYADWNTSWPQNAWSVTENAIYYQSAYLLLLSSMVNNASNDILATNQISLGLGNVHIHSELSGIILTSPNGTKYKLTVNNGGSIQIASTSSSNPGSMQVKNSSLNITGSENGFFLSSANGSLWKLFVNKSGNLVTSSIASVGGNRVEQVSGDVLIENNPNGLILKDQNNICYLINIDNNGNIFSKPTLCTP